MREIKFRARRADTGAWVYGDLTHAVKINTKEQADESGRRSQPVIRVANYDVDKNTIGQYTGCDDSQGTSIYEGDIVVKTQSKTNNRYPVTFSEGTFCIRLRDDIEAPLKMFDMKDVKVIGNIYDNPE